MTFICFIFETAKKCLMENFIVSARKYRPASFETVVGQSSLTTTLKNSIKTGHLAHAFLFCGPRGVGKTTCARIFAKTINCLNPSSEFEACNECESCKSFNENRSYNIHELDAASNNSVDDIRLLIDKVRIAPQLGKYSVYIIDEVHMLSANAFNAFLKTLEEPPKHAIFILATTEKHKIIPTILSRCQIYDFNRIKIEDITKYLQHVADQEKITVEPEALSVIAQKADGAMRDALSIFDQVVIFAGGTVTYRHAIENLNVLDYDYYFKLVDFFLAGDIKNAFLTFDEILSKGFEGQYFITGLSNHLRDILVCRDEITLSLLEVGASIRENYRLQAKNCTVDFIFEALKITNECDLSYKISLNKRLHVELALMKLCYIMAEKKNSEHELLEKKKVEQPELKPEPPKSPEKTTEAAPVIDPAIKTKLSEKLNLGKNSELDNSSEVQETISINKLLSGKSDTNAKDITPETPVSQIKTKLSEDFSKEEFKASWLRFAESIKVNEPRLYNTLSTEIPVPGNDHIINLKLTNKLLEEALNSLKGDLTEFLRGELKNDFITITTTVIEDSQEKTIRKPYTDEEKFAYLKEKYPQLQALRDRFKLDFETY